MPLRCSRTFSYWLLVGLWWCGRIDRSTPLQLGGPRFHLNQNHHQKQQHQHGASFSVIPASIIHRDYGAPTSATWTALRSDGGASGDAPAAGGLDAGAIGKYILAVGVQMGVIAGLLAGLDRLRAWTGAGFVVPLWIHAIAFYFLALKSRIFNPLSNRRPNRPPSPGDDGIGGGEDDDGPMRRMPTWTPPGFVFPIVWLLVIGPLRAVSSALVVEASGGTYATPALLSLVLHLSIGDVWNTINNVEKRYGTSVLGVGLVWASAAYAAARFGKVSPLAGRLLSIPLVWLSIASALVFRTWRINPQASTGHPAPLLPTKGDGGDTKLLWFSSSSS